MSDAITLQIDGLDDFISNVNDASGQMKGILNTAMAQSVNQIKNDAQTLAPFITGTLRRSLFTDIQDGGMTGIIGQDASIAPYGAAIEFGTIGMTINVPNGRRTRNGGRTRPYSFQGNIQPEPYLVPAFQNNVWMVQQFFEDAVLQILKVAGGQA